MDTPSITRRGFISSLAVAGASLAMFGLAGCSGGTESSGGASDDLSSLTDIKISCIAREEPEITWVAEQLADKYTITPQVFSDNASVNESVNDGSVQLNYFQNASYLDNWNSAKGANLQVYGSGICYMPYVIMSSRGYKSLDDIPSGASILVCSDASGLATELKVLQQAGLITLNDSSMPTVYDVVDNPKNLDFVLIDPRSRTGAYDDADLMLTQTMNVVLMNRDDVKLSDALYTEDCSNRNTYESDLILATSAEAAESQPQWLIDINDAFHSDGMRDFMNETYGGGKVPAF